jgi:dTDP-4-dehydrorhamnose 3,5-epimerase
MLRAMDQDWQTTEITGVLRRTLVRHEDERGVLREAWRASWAADLGIGPIAQANHTATKAGALRGLHFHQRQTDIWVVLNGDAHVGLVDIRPMLNGVPGARPLPLSLELSSGDCLLIPTGVAHGLWAISDVRLLYMVTAEYDGADEYGFAWNDPIAGVRWPGGAPLLSDRDRLAPDLATAIEGLRADPG